MDGKVLVITTTPDDGCAYAGNPTGFTSSATISTMSLAASFKEPGLVPEEPKDTKTSR